MDTPVVGNTLFMDPTGRQSGRERDPRDLFGEEQVDCTNEFITDKEYCMRMNGHRRDYQNHPYEAYAVNEGSVHQFFCGWGSVLPGTSTLIDGFEGSNGYACTGEKLSLIQQAISGACLFIPVVTGSMFRGAVREAQIIVQYGDESAESIQMVVVREIKRGEKIVDIINDVRDLTYEFGVEHAVVKFTNGTRAIVRGGEKSIDLGTGEIKRLYLHSHPFHLPATGASGADQIALEALNQSSSWLLERGLDVIKFRRK